MKCLEQIDLLRPPAAPIRKEGKGWFSPFGLTGISLALGLAIGLPGGCARVLTVTQADYINTAMHKNRKPADRTGQPLELNIVCVYPKDLEDDKPQNAPLAPDSNITSDIWYKFRPEPGRSSGGEVFDLPSNQIYLLSDDAAVYGKVVGPRLGGASEDGKRVVRIGDIVFKGLFDKRSIIYVFPKFIGADLKVLRSSPVRFHPPGHYRHDLFIEVGVRDPNGRAEQFIANKTERKMRSGDKEPND